MFNRRVPKHAQIGFGKSFAPVNLGSELATASLIAERLTVKLDEIWASPTVVPVDLAPLVNSLKPKVRIQTRLEIARLHERLGSTMIYVTHDQVEAMTLADKIVVLRDSHIEQVGA